MTFLPGCSLHLVSIIIGVSRQQSFANSGDDAACWVHRHSLFQRLDCLGSRFSTRLPTMTNSCREHLAHVHYSTPANIPEPMCAYDCTTVRHAPLQTCCSRAEVKGTMQMCQEAKCSKLIRPWIHGACNSVGNISTHSEATKELDSSKGPRWLAVFLCMWVTTTASSIGIDCF